MQIGCDDKFKAQTDNKVKDLMHLKDIAHIIKTSTCGMQITIHFLPTCVPYIGFRMRRSFNCELRVLT